MNIRCKILIALGIGFWFMTQVFVPGFAAAGGTALVYNGRWSAEGASEALADVIRSVGLEIRFFSRPQDLLTLLDGADLIAFGGTEDDTRGLRESFPADVVEEIQEFVAEGGALLRRLRRCIPRRGPLGGIRPRPGVRPGAGRA